MDSLELEMGLYFSWEGGGVGEDKGHGGCVLIRGEQWASGAERTGVDTDFGMSRKEGQKGMFRFGSGGAMCLRKRWKVLWSKMASVQRGIGRRRA